MWWTVESYGRVVRGGGMMLTRGRHGGGAGFPGRRSGSGGDNRAYTERICVDHRVRLLSSASQQKPVSRVNGTRRR